ncbi:hypothetical protein BU23DRAFT_574896 [Bimuria novae-zelandiae CBS 107.79]|uniref:Uncharacterized protein n=1 Tax=Bimuria novae-zelandiae CBS 107.79 TaxID=1447943 RepID=A0A6A5UWP3_9PLEO|nr:hypothetical protein BU23DRAFT_574896 [Bimuria novae-zelandiae CBS 107.79]
MSTALGKKDFDNAMDMNSSINGSPVVLLDSTPGTKKRTYLEVDGLALGTATALVRITGARLHAQIQRRVDGVSAFDAVVTPQSARLDHSLDVYAREPFTAFVSVRRSCVVEALHRANSDVLRSTVQRIHCVEVSQHAIAGRVTAAISFPSLHIGMAHSLTCSSPGSSSRLGYLTLTHAERMDQAGR